MAAFPTKLAELFAAQSLKRFYQKSVTEMITNNDYEGEIKNTASIINILTFGALSQRAYTGADVTWDELTEVNGQLTTDQKWYSAFKIPSLSRFRAWIKNPESGVINELSEKLKQRIDAYILGLYVDAAAGQRIGTNYTTGTVTVDVTTGAVTGSGTNFTAAMVGRPFKATGHSVWYRVKTYTSATAIVIEDDKDDETSAYTGGAIAGGTAYVIQANTSVQVTKATLYTQLVAMKTMLDKSLIPTSDRFFVAPADIMNLLLVPDAANPVIMATGKGDETAENGYLGTLAGFQLYSSEQVTGDSVNGYRCLAGHKSAITFAHGLTESKIVGDLENNFGSGYKKLDVYGAKVLDERRKALVEGFFKL